MKLSKIIYGKAIQIELTNKEFDVMALALDEYFYFLESALTNKVIKSADSQEIITLNNKIEKRFKEERKIVRSMLDILQLFY